MQKEEYKQLKEKSLLTQSHLTERFKSAISKANEKYRTELIGYVDKGIYFESNDICGYVMKPIIGEGYYNEKEWQQVKQRLNKEAELRKIVIEAIKAMAENAQTPLFAQETNKQAKDKLVGEMPTQHSIQPQPAQIVNYGEYKRQCLLQMRLHQKALLVDVEMADEIKQVLLSGVVLVEDEKYGLKIKPFYEGNKTLEEFKMRMKEQPDKMRVLNEILDKTSRSMLQVPLWSKSCANSREYCDNMSERCYCSDCRLAAYELEKRLRQKYAKNKGILYEYYAQKYKPLPQPATPAKVKTAYDEYKEQWLLQLRFRLQIRNNRYTNETIGADIDEMLGSGVVLIEEGDKYKIVPCKANETFERIKERILNDDEKMRVLKAQSKMLHEVQSRTAYAMSCENRHKTCDCVHDECYLSKCELAAAKLEAKLQAEYAATTFTMRRNQAI